MKIPLCWVGLGVLCLLPAGCNRDGWHFGTKSPIGREPQEIPQPISLLLPKSVRVHPFTGRTFDEAGGISGIDVRIEALDAYGDATKAFGDFRFEMYRHVANSLDPKGAMIATWQESLLEPKKNLLHWDKTTRLYTFKLQWDRPVSVGRRLVLVASFDSPFTKRLTHQWEFVSGQ